MEKKTESLTALIWGIVGLILVSGIGLWVLGYYLERGNDFAWALVGLVGFIIVLFLVLFTFRMIMDGLTRREMSMMNANLKENLLMMQQVQRAINLQNQNALIRQQHNSLPASPAGLDLDNALLIDDGIFEEIDHE